MVIVQSRFLEDGGYNCFFKNMMKLARAEREINDVGDCRNKNRSTGFDKPGGNRIRIALFIRTVEKRLLEISDSEADIKVVKSGGVDGEDGKCGERESGLLVIECDTEFGNFISEERAETISKRHDRRDTGRR